MQKNTLRRWLSLAIPAALFVLVFVAVGLGMRLVAADPQDPDLPPPFEGEPFTAVVNMPDHSRSAALVAAETLTHTEDFEMGIPAQEWITFDANDLAAGTIISGQYEWGTETFDNGPTITGTRSVWALGGGIDGETLDPMSDTYPANVDSWLVYGPVDMSKVSAAGIQFDYWFDGNVMTDSIDTFAVAVSTDSEVFTGTMITTLQEDGGGVGQWFTRSYDLSQYVGETTVYIGFNFRSEAAGDGKIGAFVDNLIFTSEGLDDIYLPAVRFDPSPTPTFTPTPTPTPEFQNFIDEFDLTVYDKWDIERASQDSGARREYNVFDDENDTTMEIILREPNAFSLLAPFRRNPGLAPVSPDYTVEAELDLSKSRVQDEEGYGLVFGGDADFDEFYMLQVRWRESSDDNGILQYRLVKVDSYSSRGYPDFESLSGSWREVDEESVSNATEYVEWDVDVKSNGDVSIYANDDLLETVADVPVPDNGYFGLAYLTGDTVPSSKEPRVVVRIFSVERN